MNTNCNLLSMSLACKGHESSGTMHHLQRARVLNSTLIRKQVGLHEFGLNGLFGDCTNALKGVSGDVDLSFGPSTRRLLVKND